MFIGYELQSCVEKNLLKKFMGIILQFDIFNIDIGTRSRYQSVLKYQRTMTILVVGQDLLSPPIS